MALRGRTLLLAVVSAAAAAVALALTAFAPPALERVIRRQILAVAARHGLDARVAAVRLGLWPGLRLEGVELDRPGVGRAEIRSLEARLGVWVPGMALPVQVTVAPVTLRGPAGIELRTAPTLWSVGLALQGASARLEGPSEGLALRWSRGSGLGRLEARATDLVATDLVALRRGSIRLLDPGRLTGTLRVDGAGATTGFGLDLAARGVRLPSLSGDRTSEAASPLGPPADLDLRLDGDWQAGAGALAVRPWRVSVDGATASGFLTLADLFRDPRIALSLDVERVDFARLFRTSGLARPEAVALQIGGGAGTGDLGSASLSASFRGRLADASSFEVEQKLSFTPPRRMPQAILRLRGDFVHDAPLPGGGSTAIDVSPTSPDFIAIGDVPPLFLRTLLISEDADFFGHRGIDLTELPSAILTNWARGRPARGASTITQQLAKNLFLSRKKVLGRKLQELSLALLLEAALSKDRILEIYLNVIEWGPGLYGLRPAARHYFHLEPAELTPKQMAFLVALIPGPIKYQRSFADGTPSPGFQSLVRDLLAKLRSVDALTEEEYQDALTEELHVDTAPEPPGVEGGAVVPTEPPLPSPEQSREPSY